MTAGRKFCTACGAPGQEDLQFCTSCGARFETGKPMVFPSTASSQAFQGVRVKKPPAPRTLFALITGVLTGVRDNLRSTIISVIKGMIFAFVLVLILNSFLQVTSLGQSEIARSVIAASGLGSSADALLFWFLFTAILAFFWCQLQSRGVRGMMTRLFTMPRWIWTSAMTTGSTAFPLIMAGIAVALSLRLFLLTSITGIQFLILMFGILYSQQESLAVLAMSLGYSDLVRLFKKSGPQIPPPAFPVMGVSGAFFGFLMVLFVADNLLIIAIVIILMLASWIVIQYRKERAAAIANASGESASRGRRVS